MKKTYLFLSFMMISLGLSSTKPPIKLVTGTYGVCSFAGQDENSNKIEITLNDDHSFRYIYHTGGKPIDAKGTWELKGNTVILTAVTKNSGITKKWKIDGSYACISSRKGLCWTRICHLNDCK
jgi:hypothetical protein